MELVYDDSRILGAATKWPQKGKDSKEEIVHYSLHLMSLFRGKTFRSK